MIEKFIGEGVYVFKYSSVKVFKEFLPIGKANLREK